MCESDEQQSGLKALLQILISALGGPLRPNGYVPVRACSQSPPTPDQSRIVSPEMPWLSIIARRFFSASSCICRTRSRVTPISTPIFSSVSR